jgi:hypothetical protein
MEWDSKDHIKQTTTIQRIGKSIATKLTHANTAMITNANPLQTFKMLAIMYCCCAASN